MPDDKRTKGPRARKAVEHDDDRSLREAVRRYCVAEWKKLTGVEWTAGHDREAREILNAYRSVVDAHKGLVAAIDAASRIVERYPKDAPDAPDFRVEMLRMFFESFSQETRWWVDAQRKARDERWVQDENPRARIAHWQVALGLPADAHRLAVLSLLVGHWPLGMTRGTVASVVDKERKAMVQALRRLCERHPVLVATYKAHVGPIGPGSRRRRG